MEKELLHRYDNGNYSVEIYSDGTKIKATAEDFFRADFPDSIDLKITDYCDGDCKMCHESSTREGKHANFTASFLDTLKRGTELAVGGGNPLSHPHLIDFLTRMKEQGVLCSVTVNERHLLKQRELVDGLIERELVKGVGVSLNAFSAEAVEFLHAYPLAVAHIVCGITDESKLSLLSGAKALFLGYKLKGRGKGYFSLDITRKIASLKRNIVSLTQDFEVVSFDNLALEQLGVKRLIGEREWSKRFMGEDGESSMFIDLVRHECARSSTATERFPLKDTIEECFAQVRK